MYNRREECLCTHEGGGAAEIVLEVIVLRI